MVLSRVGFYPTSWKWRSITGNLTFKFITYIVPHSEPIPCIGGCYICRLTQPHVNPLHRAILIWLQSQRRGSQAEGDMVKGLSPFSSCLKLEHPPWHTLPHHLHSSEVLAESHKLLSCKYLLFLERKHHCYMTWSCCNEVTVVGYFLCFSHSKLWIDKSEFSGHPCQQVMTYSKKKGVHGRPYGTNKG